MEDDLHSFLPDEFQHGFGLVGHQPLPDDVLLARASLVREGEV